MSSRRQYRESEAQTKSAPKHWLSTFIGIIAAVVLFMCLFARSTVLNENFMSNEIVSSNVGKQVRNDINASLSSYGIDEDVISTKQANQLLQQGLKQVYAGKPVRLDFSSVLGNLEGRASSTLSSYGVPSSVISQLPTGSLNSQVSATLNSRINNQQIQQVEDALKMANSVTISGIVISVILLVLIAVRDLVGRTVVRDFRWITLISGMISAGFLAMVKPLVHGYSADFASFATVISKITTDVVRVGWHMVLVDLALAIILFIISLIFYRRKA